MAELPPLAWRWITWAQRHTAEARRALHRGASHACSRLARGTARSGVWLLCEAEAGRKRRLNYYFVNLRAAASWRTLVRLTHQRWAIEQQYQELKRELGFDHFEGRTWRGWQQHAVLTAVAHAYIQHEPDAPGAAGLTFPAHACHRAGNLHRAAVCGQTAVHALDESGETRTPTTDLTKSN